MLIDCLLFRLLLVSKKDLCDLWEGESQVRCGCFQPRKHLMLTTTLVAEPNIRFVFVLVLNGIDPTTSLIREKIKWQLKKEKILKAVQKDTKSISKYIFY